MLAELFWVMLIAGSASAVVLWVFAARLAVSLATARRAGVLAYAGAVFWPFGARRLADASPENATRLNKMMVAFFLALLVAISSMAVYSNLTFVLPVPPQ
ncbi:hypothetical protein [Ancylobacter radicis]|uniref:Uncharacterized protein n=1 Tax=Ancylobacter radicis TaxID=2836179 RepID=A0ABS5R532_9HYPH|nr:hypothetical protein [Ancylobacter radicis]MBS9476330.1 hypothetical protein [Ancylobacter radicis]